MTQKHRGGRGRKAPEKVKHIVTGISLPPELKALLDSWVTDDLSRSEIVGQLIRAHAAQLDQAWPPPAERPTILPQTALEPHQKPRKASAKAAEGKSTAEDFEELFAVDSAASIKGSFPAILKLLRDGATLTRSEGVWMLTEPTGKTRRVGPVIIREMLREGLLTG